jgi:hypothetical protein
MDAECETYLLDKSQIEHYREKIDECLDADPEMWNLRFEDKEELWSLVFTDFIQLWAVCDSQAIHAVFMTEMMTRPRPILRVFWAYGRDFVKVVPMMDEVVDRFAARIGCEEVEIVGRKGWEKVFRDLGMKHVYSAFRRPVRHKRGH